MVRVAYLAVVGGDGEEEPPSPSTLLGCWSPFAMANGDSERQRGEPLSLAESQSQ